MCQGDDPLYEPFCPVSVLVVMCGIKCFHSHGFLVVEYVYALKTDKEGEPTSTGMECCCSYLCLLLIKLHSSLRGRVSHYLENHSKHGTNRRVKGEQNLLPPACSSTLTGLCPEESVP